MSLRNSFGLLTLFILESQVDAIPIERRNSQFADRFAEDRVGLSQSCDRSCKVEPVMARIF